eukprot:GHVR01146526.1.p3 GENE.GHVR01146526.1~~GHVR01146526.1.p3  ORF type:complete len:150 (-),score=22.92 GHVR01146526.1:1132-1581(-)
MSDGTQQSEHSLQALAYARFLRMARPLCYASEVAESLRRTYSTFLRVGYGISAAYVVGDTWHHASKAPEAERPGAIADRLVFHSLASFLLPSVVVHTAVKVAARGLPPTGAAIAGLATIPFIVHPIDHGVDFLMDKLSPWRCRTEQKRQ